jgi:Spy/CpxP family protein refolding chaperone
VNNLILERRSKPSPKENTMWFGWLIGTLCLIGLVRALMWRSRFHHHPGWAYRYGPPGFGPRFGHGPFGHGFRRGGRGFVYSILDRLDATPAQEKVILSALDELFEEARQLRAQLRNVRHEVARAVRGPTFDASSVLSPSLDETADKLRAAVARAMEKIHAVLDDEQRDELGDLMESGFARGY